MNSKRKLHSVLEDGTEIFKYPDGALKLDPKLMAEHKQAWIEAEYWTMGIDWAKGWPLDYGL